MNRIIISPISDLLFIYFPIWVGGFYISTVLALPDHSDIIFILFLLVLGETHFACTWLFFFDPKNRNFVRKRLFRFLIAPLTLLGAYFVLAYFDMPLALLIAGVASAIHVTRQSVGVMKLAGHKKHSFAEISVYTMSGLALLGGFFRFKTDYLDLIGVPFTTIGSIMLALNIAVGVLVSEKNMNRFGSYLTGSCLYVTYLFVSAPQHAIAIGVGMHWCQYLALNYKLYRPKNESKIKPFVILALISIYALFMVYFETDGYTTPIDSMSGYSYFLLIPLSGQIVHYYFDAFIWKFSDPHIRETVGKKLYA